MRILVTGITGSLGTQVTKQLLLHPMVTEIIGVSRDELRQKQFIQDKKIKLKIGDVRDEQRMFELATNIDLIFHFAALKHVDLMESNIEESIKTNIEGTRNIIRAQDFHGVPRVVLSSTDKAALPINIYGNCKALAEKVVLQNKNNVVTRYGNVVASNGSVVPMFVKTLKAGSEVFLTSLDMSRFWITLEDAAKFVVNSAFEQPGGLKIPPMKASSVKDLALTVGSILGINDPVVNVIGLRPGEKLAECLRTETEGGAVFSDTAEQFTQSELTEMLEPIVRGLA